jgi:D-3-phosphoglycerate dehydrogenase / 2-oxoglutarate reductase
VVAILTRGHGRISAALIERFPSLRVVARCGVGLDNIDLAAAAARGIPVVYAPGSTTNAVAEHTVMLMLAAARRLRQVTEAVHNGHWEVRQNYRAAELNGRTLGIVGLGSIGRRVAELAAALGMRVITWSRSRPLLSLEEVVREADVVSLHVALTPETRHLIGARELAVMKPGSILINTARGAVIDQRALAAALEQGRPAFFAADVLDLQPPDADEPLLRSERTLFTPHIAALTDRTYRTMCVSTAENVLAILRGEQPAAGSVYGG